MASDKKLFAFEEVEKHNKTKDCWLIISGKAYLCWVEPPEAFDRSLRSYGKTKSWQYASSSDFLYPES
ncbi:hypothetical protein CRG98_025689 [Punica granatum]|uniref:Uncharacterized protein n=1 Tax=Punica granatum TaxID=22663 RepID=A0A2I0JCE3_PUNGR|nr:hypothetical protein CRG98_025689 [Punica granatum]